MVFSMICDIFFTAQFFNIHLLSLKFVHTKSLDFILQFILIHIFCSSFPLPHFTFFCPLIMFILKFVFSLCTTCLHSALLLLLPYPAFQNQFSCQWSSHILFPAIKICKFSFHLQQPLLIGCGQNSCCCIFSIYLQIFTILIFRISKFTVPLSYSILPTSCSFFCLKF